MMQPRSADARTVLMLAVRHLLVRRARTLFLLLGYGIGAGVMIVLLSIGEAMLAQSRDAALVGGGDVTVLPAGIDLEALRTGSLDGLFYGMDRTRFLMRQQIGGPRMRSLVAATSPVIEDELLYLHQPDGLLPLRAGAEIPSAARAVGAGLRLSRGRWEDEPADGALASPTPQQLHDDLDRFHTPLPDSTWAEWHYFNVAPSAEEWWYITFLVGGRWDEGRGGGQLLVTRHRAGRAPARYQSDVPQARVRLDTTGADLALGEHLVERVDGVYRLRGRATGPAGAVQFDLEVQAEGQAYIPPIEIRGAGTLSGYVVPVARGTASGTICENGACSEYAGVPAYHDHNWGVWRNIRWDWGQARGEGLSLVYGGVVPSDSGSAPSAAPYFLAVVDSLGVRQILRFRALSYDGIRPVPGVPDVSAPERLRILATREADTVDLRASVIRVQATPTAFAGRNRFFLQLRGEFRVTGRLGGRPVSDSGLGFFETFVPGSP